MPGIFIFALLALVALVALVVVVAVVFGGMRPKRGGAPGIDGTSHGSDSSLSL